ncbi:hypothetical protein B5E77_13885 [Lachnoclostridium sp. An131]|jgi:hypothetical protein|uniref:DUF6514 family protein n=1 Tax=Lachnoclostridium sp. An131 TaxID=1965555 RepID=UPI000B36A76E|nr:DUF6514 family protein [Lachnoclostridium sp. An131]OUQ24222.1 hypothetical protein B5E77_13885 [Lachnoclostridium sp. An131]
MQKEFLIETRSVTDEKGNLLNLKYYLIEEESVQTRAPLYRICIKKSSAGRPGVEEAESTPPVSGSEASARKMLRQLIRNAVTPVCLLEIVDDMMTKEDMQVS